MRTHLLTLRCVVGATSLAAASLLATGAAAGSEGTIGFTARPAHSDPADPATRAYFKPVVDPGGTFSDAVIIGNPSAEAVHLIVSPVDGLTGETSGSVYANRQDEINETGAWVTVDVDRITVPARGETAVRFTVRVPPNASAGDHLAGVAFENARPQTSGGNFQVKQVMRAVVGVQVRVPGPAAFHVRLGKLGIERLDGPGVASVSVEIGNDGGALGKPELTVEMTGPAGYARTLTRQLDTILPGDTIVYPWAWPDNLPSGRYAITATATGGGTSVTRQAVIDVGSALTGTDSAASPPPVAAAPPTSADADDSGGIPPWLLVIGVLGGGLVGGVIFRRRPRQAPVVLGDSPLAPSHERASDIDDDRAPVGVG